MPGVRVGVEAAISLEWVSAPALEERALGGSQKTWPSPPATAVHLGVSLARRFGTSRPAISVSPPQCGTWEAARSGAVNSC